MYVQNAERAIELSNGLATTAANLIAGGEVTLCADYRCDGAGLSVTDYEARYCRPDYPCSEAVAASVPEAVEVVRPLIVHHVFQPGVSLADSADGAQQRILDIIPSNMVADKPIKPTVVSRGPKRQARQPQNTEAAAPKVVAKSINAILRTHHQPKRIHAAAIAAPQAGQAAENAAS
jgi:hypothetical protein